MHLTPREQERLLLQVAADVALRRKQRGLKLNYPETTAFLAAAVLEAARDGMTVADLMVYGTTLLTSNDVMDGIPEMLHDIQMEATFPDGTKLVTLHDPIRRVEGASASKVHPGEYLLEEDDIVLNEDRLSITLAVSNTGDRPVQVGSHFHFFEVNPALQFDRNPARGMRLDIPSGMAVRFEPGDIKNVQLVPLAGSREVYGHRNQIDGAANSQRSQEEL